MQFTMEPVGDIHPVVGVKPKIAMFSLMSGYYKHENISARLDWLLCLCVFKKIEISK